MKYAWLLLFVAASASAQPAPEPEGWSGMAMSESTYCGVNDVVLRYHKALAIWLGDKAPAIAIDRTGQTKACIACIAADRAIRTFAPLALDVANRPKLAARLRKLGRITTAVQARHAFDKVADVPELYLRSFPDDSAPDDAYASVQAALEALVEAAASGGVLPTDNQGCLVYEGMSEFESSPLKAIELAASSGVAPGLARRQAVELLVDLVRAARSRKQP